MKTNKYIYLLICIVAFASCKKDFLEHVSETSPTLDNYYNTATQVQGATGYLYNSVWYDYMDKAYNSIGDALSGNALTETGPNYGSGVYNLLTVSSTDPLVLSSWQSLYKVAGSATVLIKTFEQKKSSVPDPSFLDAGIAEARFIRGVAYFTIGRVFKDAPIVEDPVALAASGDYNVPRFLQKDVLRFALEDFEFAEANLPEAPAAVGRVSKYSAAGMIAKLQLYQGNYQLAKEAAQRVMSSGQYTLFPDYNQMFTSSKVNNNSESLFAIQWIASGGYGYANAQNAYNTPSTLMKPGKGTGYGSVYPTIDVINSYASNDKRRGWSMMEHGFTRADWTNVNFPSGFKYDTTGTVYEDATHIRNGSRAHILKYVVGPGTNGEPLSDNGSSSICTYILRYADVLLIYAEATLADGASTSDATALDAFNSVHLRGGNFNNVRVTALTKDIIFKERRAEFAFEGDFWFDIQRMGFAKAQALINNQERGSYNGSGINHVAANLFSENQFFLPIPQSETVSDPKLLEPAVAYYK
jgi:hypothetical protein